MRKRVESSGVGGGGKGAELRERIVRRAALEFKDGMFGRYNKVAVSLYVCMCVCVCLCVRTYS